MTTSEAIAEIKSHHAGIISPQAALMMDAAILHQRISELEKENTRLLLDLDTARHSANVMEKDRDKAEDERDAWKECEEKLRSALEWALNMNPSPCRCVEFTTPPHICIGHKALAAFDKLKGQK